MVYVFIEFITAWFFLFILLPETIPCSILTHYNHKIYSVRVTVSNCLEMEGGKFRSRLNYCFFLHKNEHQIQIPGGSSFFL